MTRHQTHFQAATSDRAARSSHRVLETPHIPASRFRHGFSTARNRCSRNGRRRGQALLISVLLMVFAAVLGATFVTVVALNLSQTARSSSINTAREAANAGLVFVNEQLTNSVNGERWLPGEVSTAPLPLDPSYPFYYTDYERAQGWDQAGFVKLPDPRSTSITGNNTPTYLTKVEPVVAPLPTDPNYERNGQLKVTVIGRSPNDDAASFKLTAYKATGQSANFTTPALLVSNWNFGLSREQNVKNLTGAGAPPVELLGGLPDIDATGGGAIAATDNPVQENPTGALIYGSLNLVGKTRFNIGTGLSRLEATGNISTGGAITAEITDGLVFENIAAPTTLRNRVLDFNNSNDPTSPTGGTRIITPSRIDTPDSRWLKLTKLSGDPGAQYGYGEGVYIDNKEDVEKVGYYTRTINYGRVAWRILDSTPNTRELQRLLQRKSFSASSIEYGNVNLLQPIVFSTTDPTKGEYAAGSAAHRLSFPRIVPNAPPSPPALNVPYSFPLIPSNVTTPVPNTLQPDPSLEERGVRGWISPTEFLPRGALIELQGSKIVITRDDQIDRSQWARNADGDVLNQAGVPASNASITPPLTNALQFNANYNAPDPRKTWRKPNGDYLTDDGTLTGTATSFPGANTYRMEINITPDIIVPGKFLAQRSVLGPTGAMVNVGGNTRFEGVIYADGNVRVRGYINSDVTIVSQNNIYVEGAINQNTGRVALLAKKNVILNPTQFAAHVAGWRVIPPNASPNLGTVRNPSLVPFSIVGGVPIPLYSVFNFRVGDVVRVGNSPTTTTWWTVSAIDDSAVNKTITLINGDPTVQSTINYGDSIRVLSDPSPTQLSTQRSNNLTDTSDVFARNLLLDGTPIAAPDRLALIHAGGGATNPAMRMTRDATAVTPGTVIIKPDTNGDRVITYNATLASSEKTIAAQGPTTYDLALDPTSNTLSGLNTLFGPDPNWDLAPASGSLSFRLAATDPAYPFTIAPGITRPFLGTTSAGAYWRPATALANLDLTAPNVLIGTSNNAIPNTAATADEDLRTVRESFYGIYNTASGGFYNADLSGATYSTPSGASTTADNLLFLKKLNSATADYRISNAKYDRANFADISNLIIGGPVKINVEATIYAQDGSWFVIPMPAMTANSATTDQANRYRRLNYQIRVASRIAQNFVPTALLDPNNEQSPDQNANATNFQGAQAQWLDATAYPTNAAGTTWNSINYVAPLSLAGNQLYLPITPDISVVR